MENELKFSTTKKRANVLPQLHSCYHSNNNNNNIWYFKTFEPITELHLKKFKTNLTPPAKQVPLQ